MWHKFNCCDGNKDATPLLDNKEAEMTTFSSQKLGSSYPSWTAGSLLDYRLVAAVHAHSSIHDRQRAPPTDFQVRYITPTPYSCPTSQAHPPVLLDTVPISPPTEMTRFGDFKPLCRNTPSYPWCNLFYREVRSPFPFCPLFHLHI